MGYLFNFSQKLVHKLHCETLKQYTEMIVINFIDYIELYSQNASELQIKLLKRMFNILFVFLINFY